MQGAPLGLGGDLDSDPLEPDQGGVPDVGGVGDEEAVLGRIESLIAGEDLDLVELAERDGFHSVRCAKMNMQNIRSLSSTKNKTKKDF